MKKNINKENQFKLRSKFGFNFSTVWLISMWFDNLLIIHNGSFKIFLLKKKIYFVIICLLLPDSDLLSLTRDKRRNFVCLNILLCRVNVNSK